MKKKQMELKLKMIKPKTFQEFIREQETQEQRKKREINEDLDYLSRSEMIEEIPIGDCD